MKPRLQSSRSRPVYRVDLVTAAMFAGALLDTWTTWVFVSRQHGFEQNPTLALLIRHSLIWIPVYLLCRPLLVPLLPEICRFGFGVYFGFMGLLFGTNNLGGIFHGHYFLDTIGFPTAQGICLLLGVAVFVWKAWKAGGAGEWKRSIMTGLGWTGVFVLIELAFFAAGILLSFRAF